MRRDYGSRAGRMWTALALAASLAALACDEEGTLAPVPVASVTVVPKQGAWTGTLQVGQSVELAAHPLAADGRELEVDGVRWASTDTSVASVSGTGRVQARRAGTAEVTASAAGKVGRILVVVVESVPAVASVSVSPQAGVLEVGATHSYTARAFAADGTELFGRTVTWSSAAPTVASVNGAGLVRALAPGYTDIRATVDGVSSAVGLTVTLPAPQPAAVARVEVSPQAAVVDRNQVRQYTARAFDVHGNELFGRTVTWRASPATVATISETGLLLARGSGHADVYATVDGVTAWAGMTVPGAEPVRAVFVSPGSASVFTSGYTQLTARVIGLSGAELEGRNVTWTSENAQVARVGTNGQVLGVTKGTTRIAATVDGITGYATVEVRQMPTGNVHRYRLAGIQTLRVPYIQIGTTRWTDPSGVSRDAFLVVHGGSLELNMDPAGGSYRQVFTVETYLASGMPGQLPVAVRQVVDEGLLFYDFSTGGLILQSSTTVGTVHRAAGQGAGEYRIPQSVLATSTQQWIWVLE